MKVLVVGGGWAGLAAAVQACQEGHEVTLIEATRHWGGRARALALQDAAGHCLRLDNGQHILIGAYTATLGLMETVGVDLSRALMDLPLGLPFPDGLGLTTPAWAARWPAPLDALAAMTTARGWSWHDRLALLRRSLAWRLRSFRCLPTDTVADVCRDLPRRTMQDLIEPLCVSALNLPPAQASGQVFLRVLRDALFGQGHGALRPAHLLLPRHDLGMLMPAKAVDWLRARGVDARTGARAMALRRGEAGWAVSVREDGAVRTEHADHVILASSAEVAGQLVRDAATSVTPGQARSLLAWADQAQGLPHTAIATVYARSPSARLPAPMLALRPGGTAGDLSASLSAQFVFDRGQLHPDDPAMQGVLAFVVSASPDDRVALETAVIAQGRQQLGLDQLTPIRTVVERRATFACLPALARPPARIADGLTAAADYVDGPYPATIEGAVRSGRQAASDLGRRHGLP